MVGVMGTGIGIEIGRKLSILLNFLTKERQLTQSLLCVLNLTIWPCRSEKASRFTPWLVWLKRSITYLHFIWTLFIGINSLFGLLFGFSEMLPTVSKSVIWWLGVMGCKSKPTSLGWFEPPTVGDLPWRSYFMFVTFKRLSFLLNCHYWWEFALIILQHHI